MTTQTTFNRSQVFAIMLAAGFDNTEAAGRIRIAADDRTRLYVSPTRTLKPLDGNGKVWVDVAPSRWDDPTYVDGLEKQTLKRMGARF